MRQVFFKKGEAVLNDVSLPECKKYDVIVKVHYSFISSGTEGATLAASSKSLLKKFTSKFG